MKLIQQCLVRPNALSLVLEAAVAPPARAVRDVVKSAALLVGIFPLTVDLAGIIPSNAYFNLPKGRIAVTFAGIQMKIPVQRKWVFSSDRREN